MSPKITVSALRWMNWLRAFLRRFRGAELSLIEEEDLTKLLKDIGRWDDLLNGNLHCSQCDKALTRENISGFIVSDGDYQFLCDSQTCLSMTKKS